MSGRTSLFRYIWTVPRSSIPSITKSTGISWSNVSTNGDFIFWLYAARPFEWAAAEAHTRSPVGVGLGYMRDLKASCSLSQVMLVTDVNVRVRGQCLDGWLVPGTRYPPEGRQGLHSRFRRYFLAAAREDSRLIVVNSTFHR